MESDPGSLLGVLDRLAGLVDPAQLPQVAELQRRVREQRFRVLVVGEAKRGKSTLINALLGRDVLPIGGGSGDRGIHHGDVRHPGAVDRGARRRSGSGPSAD